MGRKAAGVLVRLLRIATAVFMVALTAVARATPEADTVVEATALNPEIIAAVRQARAAASAAREAGQAARANEAQVLAAAERGRAAARKARALEG
ncbi:MAG: hypothetical protein ACK6DF_17280, partial [Betaproteobacteria bacterium]